MGDVYWGYTLLSVPPVPVRVRLETMSSMSTVTGQWAQCPAACHLFPSTGSTLMDALRGPAGPHDPKPFIRTLRVHNCQTPQL